MANADFLPTATIGTLKKRAELLRTIRHYFDSRGFFEVETPLLSHDIVVDRHLHPIPVNKQKITGKQSDLPDTMWLQTSPEFAMKRLLASGAESIYQVCKAFRQGESGDYHNPEFTMLEWYRVGDSLEEGMEFLGQFIQNLLATPAPQMLTYQQAFLHHAAIDPFEANLEQLAQKADIVCDQRDELLNVILSKFVEPKLGIDQPTILYDYPASQAALAKIRPASPSCPAVAERFEIYVRGTELANGYHELVDPNELRKRNEVVSQQREQDGSQALPVDSRLLAAMESNLPPCTGVALGIDRLFMLQQDASSICEVIAFPIEVA